MKRQSNDWSEDLKMKNFEFKRWTERNIVVISAETVLLEDPIYQTEPSSVYILYEEIPNFIEINLKEDLLEFTYFTIIQKDIDGIETLFELLQRSKNELFDIHKFEWNRFWHESAISVDGNNELSTNIQASIYAIASSLPSLKTHTKRDPFYGLSPSGLGVGGAILDGYRGHDFWDTETWMLPAIMLLEPQWSRELLNYRFLMRYAAQMNANETGYKGIRLVTDAKSEKCIHFMSKTPKISFKMFTFISF